MAGEDLVEVNGCIREPRRIWLWQFGHWTVTRGNIRQIILIDMSQRAAMQNWVVTELHLSKAKKTRDAAVL